MRKTKYKNQNIGHWLQDRKTQINNTTSEIYVILSKNEIVKQELDRYLIGKEKNKDKIKLTFDESKILLFEYCDENNKIPVRKTKYKNQNIGQWLQNQKTQINNTTSEIYVILSENEIVKQELDRYLIGKNKRLSCGKNI